jgi:peptide/nickel transport system permease protein
LGRNPSDLLVFVAKRLLQLLPVLFGVVAITFLVTHLTVQDPCTLWLQKAHRAQLDACRAQYGVGQPVWIQFEKYLGTLLTGNWGVDPNTGQAVLPAVQNAFPATLELVFASLFLMIVIGIPLGVLAANASGRWADHLVRIFYLSGWAAPTYLVAILFVIALGPFLGLPTGGAFSTLNPPFPQRTHFSVLDALLAGNLPYTWDAIAHLILPATALAFLNMGIATRMTRTSMLEVLPLEYVKTARMKGLSDWIVLYKHALRNALISTVTVLGLTAGALLSGTVVIESVFSWPGIGKYAFDAVVNYNFDGEIAVVVVFAIGVVVANLVSDILYGVLDPRVEWR